MQLIFVFVYHVNSHISGISLHIQTDVISLGNTVQKVKTTRREIPTQQ